MEMKVKPINKEVYTANLAAAGFKFTTKEKSKTVVVEFETNDELMTLLDIKEE